MSNVAVASHHLHLRFDTILASFDAVIGQLTVIGISLPILELSNFVICIFKLKYCFRGIDYNHKYFYYAVQLKESQLEDGYLPEREKTLAF